MPSLSPFEDIHGTSKNDTQDGDQNQQGVTRGGLKEIHELATARPHCRIMGEKSADRLAQREDDDG